MFLNVVRQQIPQQVPLTRGYYIGHRQAGPDDLIQQLSAELGHHGPLIAAEGGGQIGLHHLLEGWGICWTVELLPLPGRLQIVDVADQSPQRAEPAVAELLRLNGEHHNEVPFNSKGKVLLSGMVYCAHCGSKLVLTTSSGRRAKSEPEREAHIRYACHYKIRHPQDCDGQTGYSGEKLEALLIKSSSNSLSG